MKCSRLSNAILCEFLILGFAVFRNASDFGCTFVRQLVWCKIWTSLCAVELKKSK